MWCGIILFVLLRTYFELRLKFPFYMGGGGGGGGSGGGDDGGGGAFLHGRCMAAAVVVAAAAVVMMAIAPFVSAVSFESRRVFRVSHNGLLRWCGVFFFTRLTRDHPPLHEPVEPVPCRRLCRTGRCWCFF